MSIANNIFYHKKKESEQNTYEYQQDSQEIPGEQEDSQEFQNDSESNQSRQNLQNFQQKKNNYIHEFQSKKIQNQVYQNQQSYQQNQSYNDKYEFSQEFLNQKNQQDFNKNIIYNFNEIKNEGFQENQFSEIQNGKGESTSNVLLVDSFYEKNQDEDSVHSQANSQQQLEKEIVKIQNNINKPEFKRYGQNQESNIKPKNFIQHLKSEDQSNNQSGDFQGTYSKEEGQQDYDEEEEVLQEELLTEEDQEENTQQFNQYAALNPVHNYKNSAQFIDSAISGIEVDQQKDFYNMGIEGSTDFEDEHKSDTN